MIFVTLLAIMVRAAFFDQWGVDHFDEGVYASHVPPGPQGYGPYPLLHLYAPPLVPTLLDLVQRSLPNIPSPEILAGVICGSLTIPALWWLARSWFGPLAGVVTASLATTSDVHVLFSRSALTDPWLLLWVIVAVYFLERAVRLGGLTDIVLAGLATGIAWWTKYNGWLPLAIGATALVLHTLGNRTLVGRTPIVAWLAVAAIAGILFAAQLQLLHADGFRYSDISANHARHVVGIRGWFSALTRQYANLVWLEGPLTQIFGPLVVAFGILALRSPSAAWRVALLIAGLLGTMFVLLGSAAALTTLVVLTFACVGARAWRTRRGLHWPGCFLIAWFVGLAVATPNYQPYVRLTLPWLAACWLAAGWALARLATWIATPNQSSSSDVDPARADYRRSWQQFSGGLLLAAFIVTIIFSSSRLSATGVPAWSFSRTNLPRKALWLFETTLAGERIAAQQPHPSSPSLDGPSAIFLTYGEPAVYHALSRDARFLDWRQWVLAPIGELPSRAPESPTFIITGPHAANDPLLEKLQTKQGPVYLEPGASVTFTPSDIVLLDQFDARTLRRGDPLPQITLQCHQLLPTPRP